MKTRYARRIRMGIGMGRLDGVVHTGTNFQWFFDRRSHLVLEAYYRTRFWYLR